MKFKAVPLFLATFLLAAPAFSYVVNSTNDGADATPGDNVCATAAAECTLRAAIQEANAHAGADAITFSTQGFIVPATILPAITDQVTIDATTAPGYSTSPAAIGTPSVTINDNVGTLINGLSFVAGSDGSIVRGLRILDFSSCGISISASSVTVQNNWLVGNFDGTTFGDGIALFGNTHLIGGTAGQGNLISGNKRFGVLAGGSGHIISANWIGVGIDGTSAYENEDDGVHIFASATNVRVGANTTADGNIISGNLGDGVEIDGANTNRVIGNQIGVAGAMIRGNGGAGVRINNATGNVIGDRNTIAYNTGAGVVVANNATNNTIAGNSIHSNGGLGIDLGADGAVTPNDAGDGDGNANGYQNFPVIASAILSGGNTAITASLDSTPSTTFAISVYRNITGDASGHGEGFIYHSAWNHTTNAAGDANIVINAAGLALGDVISLTATGPTGTSEFSANVVVTAAAVAPVVQFANAGYAAAEAGGAVVVTVNRSGDLSASSTVNYTMANGTATAPADFTGSAGTLTFAAGVASQTITIPIVDDLVSESTEQFTVTLSAPAGATLGTPATTTVTITDNDAAAVVEQVPTASEWALITLGALLALIAIVKVRA